MDKEEKRDLIFSHISACYISYLIISKPEISISQS